ncbi:MAG: (Fe-S)-binding protein, partial [Proteobacteria bacterium]|nr:(Fe-S)-binding protein [Pseudomonadota bacterium]
MNEAASREILWNVNTLPNVIGLYGLLVVALLIGAVGIIRRAELWAGGTTSPEHQGRYRERFLDLFSWGLFQHGVNRERTPAIFHTLIYVGFLVLLFTTTMVFIDHDLGIRIYRGNFYLIITLLSDLFGLGLIIGCALAAHRRFIVQADVTHRRLSENLILIFLVVLSIQGFILEGLRIRATNDPWAAYSPVGLLVANFFWGISINATTWAHFIMWWMHTLTVYAFVALFPYTKFFHILASSANLFFKNRRRAKGALESLGNLEQLIESGVELSLGLGSIKDYSWKQRLDLDACTSCGRCQDACPAYNSGKILSPKWLILDTRNHMLGLHTNGQINQESILPDRLTKLDSSLTEQFTLSAAGVSRSENGFSSSGSWRASNERVQGAAKALAVNADHRIAGEVLDENVFWSCTTCMACVEACPVGIDHVSQIVGNRRNMVLMHGEIPSEAQATLRKLENQGNPFGDPNERIKWMTGLDIPVLRPGDSVDYLYWVGCLSAFDPRKQKIARALVTLMQRAGLSFGVLGKAEACTGDPARRLGEENLYQMLAKQNIATLQNVRFKTLVSNCPHCFNTIKNEYPQFGSIASEGSPPPRVIHHTQLLEELLEAGSLPLREGAATDYTFHDPCYLGRYNDEYDAPRKTLRKVPGLNIIEMDKSREKGMCCGAGGGHFWFDMKV